jgi:hypothetical protein
MTKQNALDALSTATRVVARQIDGEAWRVWERLDDGDVLISRGFGNVGYGADVESLDLAACGLTGFMRSENWKVGIK